ncbi:MAG: alpha/beta hydrolase [Firmicutes bacterium]|nr:alpha/beta hydrolase [Bacillota bacterium]
MNVFKIIPPDPSQGPMALPMLDVSGIKRKFLDVPYAGDSPRQKLDIYLPEEGDGPFPTIIFMHGGAFLGGDKRDFQLAYVLNGIARGYAVVSVEQRLAPDTKFPYPLFDFKAAIRFLRANAAKYLLDGNRFASTGTSAGAYFAVMAAATQDNPAFEDLKMGNEHYSNKVQAVVAWYGLYDLIMQVELAEEIAQPGMPVINFVDMFMGISAVDNPGIMYFTNPLNFITPAFPPILIQAGEKDQVVPFQESVILYEKVKEICGADRVEFDAFPDYLHGDPRFNDPENENRVFAFLDKHLKK